MPFAALSGGWQACRVATGLTTFSVWKAGMKPDRRLPPEAADARQFRPLRPAVGRDITPDSSYSRIGFLRRMPEGRLLSMELQSPGVCPRHPRRSAKSISFLRRTSMKAKISLIALAVASALPLAAYAEQPASRAGAAPMTPAAPATQATPANPGTSAATPAAPATAAQPAEQKAEMADFGKLDKNHDGKLSRDEADAVASVHKRFSTLDANHDGFISQQEWKMGSGGTTTQ